MTEGVFLCLGFQFFVGVVCEDALVAADDGAVFLVEFELRVLSADWTGVVQIIVVVVFLYTLVAAECLIDGIGVDCLTFTVTNGTGGFEWDFSIGIAGALHVANDRMVGNIIVVRHRSYCPFVRCNGRVDCKQWVRPVG